MKYIIWMVMLQIIYCYGNMEFYKKIWNENVEKIDSWKRPTRSVEFEEYDKDNVIDAGIYDFVIVGAGSAGAVLARRLSEIFSWRILLLEAGDDESEFSLMPGAFFPIQMSDINWGYLTVPQENACLGCNNNQCDFARGKGLGGTSGINAMLFVRGNKEDYNNWDKMGNKGWSYPEVLPYFRKMEDASNLGLIDYRFRGTNGPMQINFNKPMSSLNGLIVNANRKIGYRFGDYNAARQEEVTSPLQTTIRNGKRLSTNQAYLKPVNPPNLKILTKSLAIEIVTTKQGGLKKANGVMFIRNNKVYQATAQIEVIISAGTVNSAQLLMLSGIGPKKHLEDLGIEVKSDLPVGENLEDHVALFNVIFHTNITVENPTFEEVLERYSLGIGPLTQTYGQQVIFTNLQNAKDVPDVEVLSFQPNNFNKPEWIYKQANYKPIMNDSLLSGRPNSIINHFILLHAKSKGNIKLTSKDPLEYPKIDPMYFKEKEDMEILYKSLKKQLRLLDTPQFKAINASLAPAELEPCEGLDDDKEFWFCQMRYKGTGIFHPTGTCRMGNDTKESVVNNKLLVHGFINLRVVDASVIPTSTSGHTNAAAIMIAEKTADEIKRLHFRDMHNWVVQMFRS